MRIRAFRLFCWRLNRCRLLTHEEVSGVRRRLILASMAAVALAASSVALAAGGVTVAAPAARVNAQAAQVAAGPGYGPAAVLTGMTEQQQVGQLFMAGVPATGPVSSAISTDITTYHAGSVILTGRSSAGVIATQQLTSQLQGLATSAATDAVPLLIATDQEGGNVQVLSGPGFSMIPTALSQGSEPSQQLRENASAWGGQLAAAGVNLDLAPVLDTVPASLASTNQPIGIYQREYGYTPAAVTAAGTAFIQGMQQAGVSVAIKHFPGLGRASGNTDTTYGVTDTVTTYNDPYLQPYASAVYWQGVPVVMVSEAIYTQIDPGHQAVFSPTVLGGMLRGELGFHGVIMSDSMEATAVSELTPAQQAVDFISAGGDLVLTTDPTVIPAMYNAVLAQAQADPAFAALVSQAALTILMAKQQTGLIGGTTAAAATGPASSP
jgi:beta-N-acetylhexosaminidase